MNVTALSTDDKENVWAAALVQQRYLTSSDIPKSEAVLYRINQQTGRETVYQLAFTSSYTNEAIQLFVYDIHPDESGVLWLATGFGLLRFHPRQNQLKKYQHDPADPRSLSYNHVSGISAPKSPELSCNLRQTSAPTSSGSKQWLYHLPFCI